MGNLLPLVGALLLAGLSLDGRGGAGFSLPGILAFLAAYYAAGRVLAGRLAAEGLRQGANPGVPLARFRRAAGLHRMLALPAYAFVLWPGGWASLAALVRASAGDFPALLAAFAPYLLILALARASTHPAERRLGLQPLPFGSSLLQSARLGGLVVVPLVLVTILTGAAGILAATDEEPFRALADLAARWDFVAGAYVLAGLAGVLAVFPVLAMRILGARPFPDGPLRRRLEAYAVRVGLRYRDLYLWPTGGTLPNAAVMGVGRGLRCVVFTDALLERLDDEEVEAVFAHEAGHAIHGHLPLFFLFTVAYTLAVFAGMRFLPADLAARVEVDGLLAAGLTMAGILVYFGLLFGFVSRRLEQQADVHGFLTVGLPEGEDPARVLAEPERHPFLRTVAEGGAAPSAHPFVRSLDGIASALGGVRELTGWRHFSIADRVDFLERFARDPGVRLQYRRRLQGLLALMAAVFVLFAAAAATDLPVQAKGPSPEAALSRAGAALRRGRPDEARRWIEGGLRGAAARGRALSPIAERVPPGRPVPESSVLLLAQHARSPEFPAVERFRLRECEAILRSVLGQDEAAVACAGRAQEILGRRESIPAGDLPLHAALRAENLRLLADLLRRAGRPAAADDALARAGAEEGEAEE